MKKTVGPNYIQLVENGVTMHLTDEKVAFLKNGLIIEMSFETLGAFMHALEEANAELDKENEELIDQIFRKRP